MIFRIGLVTPAAQVPLVFDAAEAKRHLVVEHDEDDVLIENYIRAAQGMVEDFTAQVLTVRQLRWTAAGFPRLPEPVRLWRTPVTGIDAISYAGPDGAQVALAAGEWRWEDADSDVVMPPLSGDWPAAHAAAGPSAVRVTFTAGYEPGLAPSPLVEAVRLTLGHFYFNRGDGPPAGSGQGGELPAGALFLARPYRAVTI